VRLTGEGAAFARGVEEGRDPQPEVDEQAAEGMAVTQKSSSWAYQFCTTCGHTFRRGDRVLRGADGSVRHLDARLRCAVTDESVTATATDEARAFAEGLLAAWPPAAHVEVVTLAAGDWRIARAGRALSAPVCVQCAHTFRPGEMVVVCPCQPAPAPGSVRCGKAIHRDPAAGLPCWESWKPSGDVRVCPVSHTRVDPSSGMG
jgi:hypothetical protein